MVEKITKAFFSFEFEVFGRVQGYLTQNFGFSRNIKIRCILSQIYTKGSQKTKFRSQCSISFSFN